MPGNASGRGSRPSGTLEPRWRRNRISGYRHCLRQHNKQKDNRVQTEQAAVLEVVRQMDDDPMVPQEENGHGNVSEVEDMH